MAKMRKLSPEMARLKERHGEDRQAFSQAMMELYKRRNKSARGMFPYLTANASVFSALLDVDGKRRATTKHLLFFG